MAEDRTLEQEHHLSRRQVAERGRTLDHEVGFSAPAQGYSPALLRDPGVGGRANGGTRAQLLSDMQRMYGNRAVQRYVGQASHAGTAGVVPVQRAPAKRHGVVNEMKARWDAVMRGMELERIKQIKAEMKQVQEGTYDPEKGTSQDGACVQTVKGANGGTEERLCPAPPRQMPACLSWQVGKNGPEMECRDPWDHSAYVDQGQRSPEVIAEPPGKPVTPNRGTNGPVPAHWEDGSQ